VPTSLDITRPAMLVPLLALFSNEGWLCGAGDEERYVGGPGTDPIH
jgi:hypothetical protein